MDRLLSIAQIILGVFLTITILLQARGTGLGTAFGGSDALYRTKRGIEKSLFIATIIFGALFFGVAFANVLW
ncbi:preprotein translocase subunit SecG [Candidatus Uhrbacteria bacterium]|nr:preprotein translocase subunit SecG [Candidatus Uhrbacteria bacterium]